MARRCALVLPCLEDCAPRKRPRAEQLPKTQWLTVPGGVSIPAFTLEHEKWLADEPEKDLGAIGFAGWPAYLGLGHVFLTSVFARSRPELSVAEGLVGERSRPRPPRAWLAFQSDAGRAARSHSGKLR